MSLRRRLFLPSYSKTLSVGQARVWNSSLLRGSTILIHTFLTYWTSGWYFGGINIMINLSTSWIPDSEHTPRYKSTPNITGTGMRLSAGAKRIEIPVTQVNCMWKCVYYLIIITILYHELNTNNNNNNNKNYYSVVVVLGRKVWLAEISSNHQNYKTHVTTFLVCFSSKTDLHETTLQVATILLAMAPTILKLVTWFVKKSP